MVDELYRSVDTVQLTGILPGVFRLDISEGDLTAVVPVDQSLLVIDLDGPRRQKSHSVLPGDHILAWPETVVNQGPGHAVSTFIVDEAREGHVIPNFDLKPFPGGLEVRPPVFCGEENRVEIVLGVDTPCRQERGIKHYNSKKLKP